VARILVVDEDPWTERAVQTVVAQAGHAVNRIARWSSLDDGVGDFSPHLIVAGASGAPAPLPPLADLRARRPSWNDVPFLLLTESQQQPLPRGFRKDLDERLAKPFRLDELARAVNDVLARELANRRATQPRRPSTRPVPLTGSSIRKPAALTGLLNEIGLASVLILLEMERKTGLLELGRPEAQGRLSLRQGKIVRAEMRHPEPLQGRAAVYRALTTFVTEGFFEFRSGEIEGEDDIKTSTSFLLMESARLMDEAAEAERRQREREIDLPIVEDTIDIQSG